MCSFIAPKLLMTSVFLLSKHSLTLNTMEPSIPVHLLNKQFNRCHATRLS